MNTEKSSGPIFEIKKDDSSGPSVIDKVKPFCPPMGTGEITELTIEVVYFDNETSGKLTPAQLLEYETTGEVRDLAYFVIVYLVFGTWNKKRILLRDYRDPQVAARFVDSIRNRPRTLP